ncbi:esterase/lipase family protein [Nocardia sp. NBC_01388]|uniref:esterase/lipase family protein n=1 Tax=Nocardia sp. NBC_01388 TaxID=2903596 RepID=UPI00324D8B52
MRTIAGISAVLAIAGFTQAGTAAAAPQPATPLDTLTACAAHVDAPVLLIHGTNASVEKSLGPVRQALLDDGRCVYGLEYDSQQPISVSADYFAAAVDRITELNGASSVDVVGKSQGALIARATSLEFAARPVNPVRAVVAVSGPQYGVGKTVAGVDIAPLVAPVIPPNTSALTDMLAGSAYLTRLTSGPMVAPGVRYTMIASRDDELVTPYTSAFIDAPGVTNIVLQDGCPDDHAGHIAESTDPRSVDLVLNALDPVRHPALRCTPNADRK